MTGWTTTRVGNTYVTLKAYGGIMPEVVGSAAGQVRRGDSYRDVLEQLFGIARKG